MKTQLKILIPVLLLILSGCGHHAGYHSTYPDVDQFSISVSGHAPHYSYPDNYNHDVYLHRDYKYYKKQHYVYDKHHKGYDKRHSRPHVSNKHFKHGNHKQNEYYGGRYSKDNYYPGSRNRHDKQPNSHVSNKHLKNKNYKRKEYYASRDSNKDYSANSRNRDNRHSKGFVSRKSGSGNKNTSQKRDNGYSGNHSYRNR